MHPRFKVPMFAAALLVCCNQAAAQTGPYIQMDLGLAVAPPLAVHGSNNDWGTKCDLLINPLGVEVGNECDAAPPRAAWLNELGGAPGIRTGFAVGYDWGALETRSRVLPPAHPLQRAHGYRHRNGRHPCQAGAGDRGGGGRRRRPAVAQLLRERVLRLRALHRRAWTPYLGAGVGIERASLDYFSLWKRNHDPDRITTFSDPLLRARLAGTTSLAEARLTDSMAGYQLLGGVDYRLSDPVTLGVKFRWADFGEFASEPRPWNQLRSHESDIGRGEPILYQVTTEDSRFWGVSLSLKYRF